MLEELKEQLNKAQARMKRHADEHRRDVEFNEGEWVYLKLRPYRQQSVARRRNEKLAPKYYGPFRIIARIGKVAYKLQLPETTSIHPVFHVSLLKKAMGMNDASSKLPVTLTEDMEIILEPEQVEGIRGGACEAEMEVLIKWKDLPGFESTWEPFVTIKKQFLSSTLRTRWLFGRGVLIRPGLRKFTKGVAGITTRVGLQVN